MSQRAGWYDDPDDPLSLRYFDGVIWTNNRQPKASPTAARSTIGYAGAPGTPGGPAVGGAAIGPKQPPAGWGQQPPAGWGQQPPAYGAAYGSGHAGLGVKTTPDGAPLAGWGTRLGAYVIDSVLQGVVASVVGSYWLIDFFRWYVDYLNAMLDQANPTIDQAALQSAVVQRLFPFLVVSLLVQLVYQLAFLTWRGATPGKMLLKLQVRRRDRPGPPDVVTVLRRLALPVLLGAVSLPLQLVGGSQGLGRAGLVAGVSLVLSAVQFLDYLWPLWDERNQALHDKLARTNVVVVPPKGR